MKNFLFSCMERRKTFTLYAGNMFGGKGKKFLDHMLINGQNNIKYLFIKSSIDTRSKNNIIVRDSKPIPAFEITPEDDFLRRIYEIEQEVGYEADILMADELQFFPKKHIIDMLYLRDSDKKSTVGNGLLLDHTGKPFNFLDPKVIAIDNESEKGQKEEGHHYEPRCFHCYIEGIKNGEGYITLENIEEIAPHLIPWIEQEIPRRNSSHPSLDSLVHDCQRQADVENMNELQEYVDFSFYLPAVCKCGNPAEYPYRLD